MVAIHKNVVARKCIQHGINKTIRMLELSKLVSPNRRRRTEELDTATVPVVNVPLVHGVSAISTSSRSCERPSRARRHATHTRGPPCPSNIDDEVLAIARDVGIQTDPIKMPVDDRKDCVVHDAEDTALNVGQESADDGEECSVKTEHVDVDTLRNQYCVNTVRAQDLMSDCEALD